jgi:hypothetical protein
MFDKPNLHCAIIQRKSDNADRNRNYRQLSRYINYLLCCLVLVDTLKKC